MARPTKENNKNARLNLALLPELKHSIEKLSHIDEISVNSLIGQILSAYVDNRKDEVSEYDELLNQIRQKRDKKSKPKNTKPVAQVSDKGGGVNG